MREIYASSFILLTGTPLHNRWADLSGLLQFLKGHPFSSPAKFSQIFTGESLAGEQKAHFQKLLQGTLISRPATVLTLPPVYYEDVMFGRDESVLVV